MDESSIKQFLGVQKPEEHYFPTALSFEICCCDEKAINFIHHQGQQRTLLSNLEKTESLIFLKPIEICQTALQLGLTPLFFDSSINSITSQREFLLNLALEQQMTGWLCKCANTWSNGRFKSSGCTLEFFLEWAWNRIVILKTNADALSTPLFDYSESIIDANNQRIMNVCINQLVNLFMIYDYVLKKLEHFILQKDLVQQQFNSLQMVVAHLEAVQWLVNTGLLPETSKSYLYPIDSLLPYYSKRRSEVQDAYKQRFSSDECLLFIDNLFKNEFYDMTLQEYWKKDDGNGSYPPPSMQSLLRTYLIDNVNLPTKHSIIIYAFLDLAMALDREKHTFIITQLIKFPTIFGLNPSIIRLTQAFWHLDHRDFGSALERLLDPLIPNNDLKLWHHRTVLNAFLVQGQHNLALTYYQIRKPYLKDDDDVLKILSLFAQNNMICEAMEFQRKRVTSENQVRILTHLYSECNSTKQMKKILHYSLTDKEEKVLMKYLHDIAHPHQDEFEVMYYLQRFRYMDIFQMSKQQKSTAASSGLLGQKALPFRESFAKTLSGFFPKVSSDLFQACQSQKNLLGNKVISRPRPMSVVVHNTEEQAKYKSTLIQIGIAKARETWNKPLQKSSTNITADNLPFMRMPITPSSASRKRPSIICPKIIKVNEETEDTGESPSKKQKLSPRQSIGTLLASRSLNDSNLNVSLSKMTKLDTPVIKRKSRRLSEQSLQDDAASSICTPQSILKVRNLITSHSLLEEDTMSSSLKINSCPLTAGIGLTPRKSLSRLTVHFEKNANIHSSTENSDQISRILNLSSIVAPVESSSGKVQDSSDTKDSSEEIYYSPESSLEENKKESSHIDKPKEVDKSNQSSLEERKSLSPVIDNLHLKGRSSYKDGTAEKIVEESSSTKQEIAVTSVQSSPAPSTPNRTVRPKGRKSLSRMVLENNALSTLSPSTRRSARLSLSSPSTKPLSSIIGDESKTSIQTYSVEEDKTTAESSQKDQLEEFFATDPITGKEEIVSPLSVADRPRQKLRVSRLTTSTANNSKNTPSPKKTVKRSLVMVNTTAETDFPTDTSSILPDSSWGNTYDSIFRVDNSSISGENIEEKYATGEEKLEQQTVPPPKVIQGQEEESSIIKPSTGKEETVSPLPVASWSSQKLRGRRSVSSVAKDSKNAPSPNRNMKQSLVMVNTTKEADFPTDTSSILPNSSWGDTYDSIFRVDDSSITGETLEEKDGCAEEKDEQQEVPLRKNVQEFVSTPLIPSDQQSVKEQNISIKQYTDTNTVVQTESSSTRIKLEESKSYTWSSYDEVFARTYDLSVPKSLFELSTSVDDSFDKVLPNEESASAIPKDDQHNKEIVQVTQDNTVLTISETNLPALESNSQKSSEDKTSDEVKQCSTEASEVPINISDEVVLLEQDKTNLEETVGEIIALNELELNIEDSNNLYITTELSLHNLPQEDIEPDNDIVREQHEVSNNKSQKDLPQLEVLQDNEANFQPTHSTTVSPEQMDRGFILSEDIIEITDSSEESYCSKNSSEESELNNAILRTSDSSERSVKSTSEESPTEYAFEEHYNEEDGIQLFEEEVDDVLQLYVSESEDIEEEVEEISEEHDNGATDLPIILEEIDMSRPQITNIKTETIKEKKILEGEPNMDTYDAAKPEVKNVNDQDIVLTEQQTTKEETVELEDHTSLEQCVTKGVDLKTVDTQVLTEKQIPEEEKVILGNQPSLEKCFIVEPEIKNIALQVSLLADTTPEEQHILEETATDNREDHFLTLLVTNQNKENEVAKGSDVDAQVSVLTEKQTTEEEKVVLENPEIKNIALQVSFLADTTQEEKKHMLEEAEVDNREDHFLTLLVTNKSQDVSMDLPIEENENLEILTSDQIKYQEDVEIGMEEQKPEVTVKLSTSFVLPENDNKEDIKVDQPEQVENTEETVRQSPEIEQVVTLDICEQTPAPSKKKILRPICYDILEQRSPFPRMTRSSSVKEVTSKIEMEDSNRTLRSASADPETPRRKSRRLSDAGLPEGFDSPSAMAKTSTIKIESVQNDDVITDKTTAQKKIKRSASMSDYITDNSENKVKAPGRRTKRTVSASTLPAISEEKTNEETQNLRKRKTKKSKQQENVNKDVEIEEENVNVQEHKENVKSQLDKTEEYEKPKRGSRNKTKSISKDIEETTEEVVKEQSKSRRNKDEEEKEMLKSKGKHEKTIKGKRAAKDDDTGDQRKHEEGIKGEDAEDGKVEQHETHSKAKKKISDAPSETEAVDYPISRRITRTQKNILTKVHSIQSETVEELHIETTPPKATVEPRASRMMTRTRSMDSVPSVSSNINQELGGTIRSSLRRKASEESLNSTATDVSKAPSVEHSPTASRKRTRTASQKNDAGAASEVESEGSVGSLRRSTRSRSKTPDITDQSIRKLKKGSLAQIPEEPEKPSEEPQKKKGRTRKASTT